MIWIKIKVISQRFLPGGGGGEGGEHGLSVVGVLGGRAVVGGVVLLLHLVVVPLQPGGICIKMGLPGKSILGDYFQENRTSRGLSYKKVHFKHPKVLVIVK